MTNVNGTKTDRKDKLRKDIDKVDTWANIASDNGLFKNQTAVKYDDVQNKLNEARMAVDANNLSEAETTLSFAAAKYSEAVYSATKRWRFENLYAGPMWIYLVGFLVAIFLFYYFGADTILGEKTGFVQAAVFSTTWGVIGSILRGLWYLKERVDKREYRNSWTVYFISTPFLGGIFGAVIYLLITGGLLSVSEGQADISNPYAIIPFAAFAGFSWEWAVGIFRKIEDLFVVNKANR